MNHTLRYLAIFLIVILCTVALTSGYANAKTVPKDEITKKVIRDKICGDMLCPGNEKIKTPPEKMKEKTRQMEKEIEKKTIKSVQRTKKA